MDEGGTSGGTSGGGEKRAEERGPGEERLKEAQRRIRYCVRQPRRRRRGEGERGLEGRAFKVTTVCYLTCCGHVTSRMEGIKGRSCPLSPPAAVSPFLPPPCVSSSVCVARAERSSATSHLALVAYTVSDFARLPAWPDCRALPSVDGLKSSN